MRTLEEIDRDLAAARESLSTVKGMPAEVYSRIVGYYRSVRNWNKGKREEYGERRLFRFDAESLKASAAPGSCEAGQAAEMAAPAVNAEEKGIPEKGLEESRLLLFVRSACPACPSAKAAAGRLGIPVDLVNADTADGLAEAQRYQVYATPTAILFNRDGREIQRALDSQEIAALDRLVV
jgi:ribonucleoside-triphosphate reductase